MTGQGFSAFANVVLVGFLIVAIAVGLVVAGIAWIFTTGLTALLIGAVVPAAYLLFIVLCAFL